MFRLAALPLAAVLLVACEQKDKPTPTAPTAGASPSAAVGPNVAAALGEQQAAVCRAYRKERAALRATLVKQPSDEAQRTLQAQDSALAVMIADACN